MFTGIIEQTGLVTSIGQNYSGMQLQIRCNGWELPVNQGESISVSGCCLTVVHVETVGNQIDLDFDVIPETIKMTTFNNLSKGNEVNIERALRADGLLGGHFIQGHIDGISEIIECDSVLDGEIRLRLNSQSLNQNALIPKGSITIDGVSLTIASIEDNWIEVALIPLTITKTTFRHLTIGDSVNIETDLLARTVDQILNKTRQQV